MFKGLFRQRRANKENEHEQQQQLLQQQQRQQHQQQQQQQQQECTMQKSHELERNSLSYRSARSSRDKRSSGVYQHYYHHHHRDDDLATTIAPYQVAPSKKYHRGTQSCCDSFGDDFDRASNTNRSFGANILHSKHRASRRDYLSNNVRRSHMASEYGSHDQSPNSRMLFGREVEDSDNETWNSERVIKELRAELRMSNERKNYYKDLYRRERQDRIRDRELRDLVEKKLMDDLRCKEIECANIQMRIKTLEQQLQHHETFPPPMRESSFRIAHFCTPSTSNTASTMAGAGEALSSTSELFALRNALVQSISPHDTNEVNNELPDETKIFRHSDEYPLELARRDTSPAEFDAMFSNQTQTINATILEEDRQSDNGYGTTSECASELKAVRRVHSDSQVPLKTGSA